jgi:hypothetical protein
MRAESFRPEPPRSEPPRSEPPRSEPPRPEPSRAEPLRPEPPRPTAPRPEEDRNVPDGIPAPVEPIYPERDKSRGQEASATGPQDGSSWFANAAASEPEDSGDETKGPVVVPGELVQDEDVDADDATPSLETIAAAEALLLAEPIPVSSESAPEDTDADTGTDTPADTDADADTAEDSAEDSSATPEREVTVVPGVPRYHRPDCILVRFMGAEDLETMTLQAAADSGSTPCGACQPEADSAPE